MKVAFLGAVGLVLLASGCVTPAEEPHGSSADPLTYAGTYAGAGSTGTLMWYDPRNDANPSLPDVPAAFAAIRTGGARIGASSSVLGGGFYSFWYGSFLLESGSHFEGIGRLPTGHLVASGNERGELMLLDLASRRRTSGRFGENRSSSTLPPSTDGFVAVNGASTLVLGHDGYTHLGGLSVLGSYVAVGLEREDDSGSDSFVHLVDFAAPTAPRVIAGATLHNATGTAGAVAIAKRPDGTFFMAVGGWDSASIEFWASTTTDIENPAWRHVRRWTKGECVNDVAGDGTCFAPYQNLDLVTQSDGSVYMLGTNRNSSGQDWIDLFSIRDVATWPSIHKIGKKHMTCTDGCDFMAAAGTYVDGPSGEIYVYATEWRRSTLSRAYGAGPLFLRMNEF